MTKNAVPEGGQNKHHGSDTRRETRKCLTSARETNSWKWIQSVTARTSQTFGKLAERSWRRRENPFENIDVSLYPTETSAYFWREEVLPVSAGAMSGGVRDVLSDLLVLGEPHPDSAPAVCHCQTRSRLQKVSPCVQLALLTTRLCSCAGDLLSMIVHMFTVANTGHIKATTQRLKQKHNDKNHEVSSSAYSLKLNQT